ncbi:Protocadherin Fat 4, partial [Fragariocoptes setiger]
LKYYQYKDDQFDLVWDRILKSNEICERCMRDKFPQLLEHRNQTVRELSKELFKALIDQYDVGIAYASGIIDPFIKILTSTNDPGLQITILHMFSEFVRAKAKVSDKLIKKNIINISFDLANNHRTITALDGVSKLLRRILETKRFISDEKLNAMLNLQKIILSQTYGINDASHSIYYLIHRPSMREFYDEQLITQLLVYMDNAHEHRMFFLVILSLLKRMPDNDRRQMIKSKLFPRLKEIVINSCVDIKVDAMRLIDGLIYDNCDFARDVFDDVIFVDKLEQFLQARIEHFKNNERVRGNFEEVRLIAQIVGAMSTKCSTTTSIKHLSNLQKLLQSGYIHFNVKYDAEESSKHLRIFHNLNFPDITMPHAHVVSPLPVVVNDCSIPDEQSGPVLLMRRHCGKCSLRQRSTRQLAQSNAPVADKHLLPSTLTTTKTALQSTRNCSHETVHGFCNESYRLCFGSRQCSKPMNIGWPAEATTTASHNNDSITITMTTMIATGGCCCHAKCHKRQHATANMCTQAGKLPQTCHAMKNNRNNSSSSKADQNTLLLNGSTVSTGNCDNGRWRFHQPQDVEISQRLKSLVVVGVEEQEQQQQRLRSVRRCPTTDRGGATCMAVAAAYNGQQHGLSLSSLSTGAASTLTGSTSVGGGGGGGGNVAPRFVTDSGGPGSGANAATEIVVRVKEGPASVNKLIYELRADDPDDEQVAFGAMGAHANELVRIEQSAPRRANVYLRRELDREMSDSHQLVLTLTDGKLGRGNWITKSMLIIVEDINDNRPVFGPHPTSIALSECAVQTLPSLIDTIEASDADEGRFGQLFYRLYELDSSPTSTSTSTSTSSSSNSRGGATVRGTNTGPQTFAVDTVDGKAHVSLVGALDFEQQPLHQLKLLAIDRAAEPERLSATAHIVVRVDDCADQSPVFTHVPSVVHVPEDSELGRQVAHVHAIDGDRGVNNGIAYSLIDPRHTPSGTADSQAHPSLAQWFAIDPISGVISVSGRLDRELLVFGHNDANADASTDSSSSTHANEPAPPLPVAANGAYVLRVRATEVTAAERTPTINLNEVPNYVEAEMTVVITDANDEAPQFARATYVGEIVENSPPDSLVQFLSLPTSSSTSSSSSNNNINWQLQQQVTRVIDRDSGTNGTFTLELMGAGAQLFEVWPREATNEANFILKVRQQPSPPPTQSLSDTQTHVSTANGNSSSNNQAALLDYEHVKQVQLILVARERNERERSTQALITVNIRDANDNFPQFEHDLYRVEIPEDAARGTHICTVRAHDLDAGLYGTAGIRYTELRGEKAHHFRLDALNGAVTLKSAPHEHGFDRETVGQHHLIVEARDANGAGNRNTSQILIVLGDANDQAPQFVMPRGYEARIFENERDFATPLVVHAVDNDAPNTRNSRITYSIVAGDPLGNFTIDPTTGRIRVRSSSAAAAITLSGATTAHTNSPNSLTMSSTSSSSSELDSSSGNAYAIAVPLHEQQQQQQQQPVVGLDYERAPRLKLKWLRLASMRDQPANRAGNLAVNQVASPEADDSSNDEDEVRAFNLTVRAQDSGLPEPKWDTTNVIVIVMDKNDHAPVFTQSVYNARVREDTREGARVVQVRALDADASRTHNKLTYRLVGGASDKFVVDADTGVVSVAPGASLDVNYSPQSVTATSTSGGSGPHGRSTSTNNNGGFNQHSERTTGGDRVHVLEVAALDGVALGRGDRSARALVNITVIDVNNKRPEFVTVSGSLSNPSNNNNNNNMVHDNRNNQHVSTMSSASTAPADAVYVSEDAPFGTLVTRVVARDPDVGAQLRYSIASIERVCTPIANSDDVGTIAADISEPHHSVVHTGASALPSSSQIMWAHSDAHNTGHPGSVGWLGATSGDSAAPTFTVDPVQGVVRVARPLDRETCDTYRVRMRVDDIAAPLGDTTQAAFAWLTVRVTDVNDNRPTFRRHSFRAAVSENAPLGTTIVTLQADDRDINKTLRYSLEGAHDMTRLVRINARTGEVSVGDKIDRETHPLIVVGVRAEDSGLPAPLSSTAQLTIHVRDENDNNPVFVGGANLDGTSNMSSTAHQALLHNNLLGNQALVAPNHRAEHTLTTNYISTADNSIGDSNNNNVTSFDRAERAHKFTVSPPLLLAPGGVAYVAEDAPVGQQVARVYAVDADAGDNGRVTYAITAGARGHFRIARDTGVLSVAAPLDRETQDMYALTLEARDEADASGASGTEPRHAYAHVTLRVTDVNEHAPRVTLVLAQSQSPSAATSAHMHSTSAAAGHSIADDHRRPQPTTTSTTNVSTAHSLITDQLEPLDGSGSSSSNVHLSAPDSQCHVHVSEFHAPGAPIVTLLATDLDDANTNNGRVDVSLVSTGPPEEALFELRPELQQQAPQQVDKPTEDPPRWASNSDARRTFVNSGAPSTLTTLDNHSHGWRQRRSPTISASTTPTGAYRLALGVAHQLRSQQQQQPAPEQRFSSATTMTISTTPASSSSSLLTSSSPVVEEQLVASSSQALHNTRQLNPQQQQQQLQAHLASAINTVTTSAPDSATSGPAAVKQQRVQIVLARHASLRDRVGRLTLLVRASDRATPSLASLRPIDVCVDDVNDHAPEFVRPARRARFRVPESATAGQRVVQVEAHDADHGLNGRVVYSLEAPSAEPAPTASDTSGPQAAAARISEPTSHRDHEHDHRDLDEDRKQIVGLFAIDPDSGWLSVSPQLHTLTIMDESRLLYGAHAHRRLHTVRVRATDRGTPTRLWSELELQVALVGPGGIEPQPEFILSSTASTQSILGSLTSVQQQQVPQIELQFTENVAPNIEAFELPLARLPLLPLASTTTTTMTSNDDTTGATGDDTHATNRQSSNGRTIEREQEHEHEQMCYTVVGADDKDTIATFSVEHLAPFRVRTRKALDREQRANYTLYVRASLTNCSSSVAGPANTEHIALFFDHSSNQSSSPDSSSSSAAPSTNSQADGIEPTLSRPDGTTTANNFNANSNSILNMMGVADRSVLRVLVRVRDINDNAPEFTQRVYTGGVTTDAEFGTTFMIVTARDADVDSQLTYFIVKPIVRRHLSPSSSSSAWTASRSQQVRSIAASDTQTETRDRSLATSTAITTANANSNSNATALSNTLSIQANTLPVDGNDEPDVSDDELFVINAHTGEIRLNFDPQKNMKGYFEFNVKVNDTDGLSDTAKVYIYLLRQDQRVKFVLRLTPQELRQRLDRFRSVFGNITGAIVNIDSYKYYENHDGTVDKKKTNLFLHFVNADDNTIIDVDKVLALIDKNLDYLDELYKEFHVLSSEAAALPMGAELAASLGANSPGGSSVVSGARGVALTGSAADTVALYRTSLVGVACGMTLVLVLLIAVCLHQRTRYERQLKAATVAAFTTTSGPPLHHLDPDYQSHSANHRLHHQQQQQGQGQHQLPNTNVHSHDPNPMWVSLAHQHQQQVVDEWACQQKGDSSFLVSVTPPGVINDNDDNDHDDHHHHRFNSRGISSMNDEHSSRQASPLTTATPRDSAPSSPRDFTSSTASHHHHRQCDNTAPSSASNQSSSDSTSSTTTTNERQALCRGIAGRVTPQNISLPVHNSNGKRVAPTPNGTSGPNRPGPKNLPPSGGLDGRHHCAQQQQVHTSADTGFTGSTFAPKHVLTRQQVLISNHNNIKPTIANKQQNLLAKAAQGQRIAVHTNRTDVKHGIIRNVTQPSQQQQQQCDYETQLSKLSIINLETTEL